MRGLKAINTPILSGYQLYHNYIRPHEGLDGKTPAQVARMGAPNNWRSLIEQATKHEAELLTRIMTQDNKAKEQAMKVIAR